MLELRWGKFTIFCVPQELWSSLQNTTTRAHVVTLYLHVEHVKNCFLG